MDKPLTLTPVSNRFRNHSWLLGVAVLLVLLLIYQPTPQLVTPRTVSWLDLKGGLIACGRYSLP